MTQADSVHSTPPTNTPISQNNPVDATTRRRFLSRAVGAAASGTVLALATSPPASAAVASASPLDPAVHPDARLFELEEKIFKHKEASDAFEPEADRLSDIWTMENKRMSDEYEATRTFKEQKAIIDDMPEFKEYMRLRGLQTIQREAADELVKQMWEIKAQTPEGRRAKVVVLLWYVMEDDEWRRVFDEPFEPFDVTRARDLLIEFVGGEPAAQLRDQFA
jgi:hypothetical protein